MHNSFDSSESPILKRHLPEPVSHGEPSTKRAKSEDPSKPLTIADKVTQNAYENLDDFVVDVARATDARIKDLEAAGATADENAIAEAAAFKTKALELYRRELAYPNVPPPSSSGKVSSISTRTGGVVLSTVGMAPTMRPLFTSLRQAPDGSNKPLPETALPNGVSVTRVLQEPPLTGDKSGRTPTLGELFPSPRNLPPLQPPKAPKTTTKSNVLTFYHPEFIEKSKYRTGTYFSQVLSQGVWLDYTNATPTVHTKTKQRERAQSLAGVKPSSIELEMTELEALFRGAFSSFAPSRDDSGAIVPAQQVSRIWYQRIGRRNLNKMVEEIEPEVAEEDGVPARADSAVIMEVDEERVKEVIENWDDSLIDPNLDSVLGKKSDEEKQVDDILEEISDMIETLASYQRNRNLTLPTSQDRYSADPVNGDMLRNGSASHQPSEEEMMAYQALKSQLALIIQTLPPWAVARLNSDKLAELAVSTKIEVRSDDYRGVMEEDEPARQARLAAQVATTNQRQSQRAPSVAAAQYANHQYQPQFTPSARPVPNAPHYQPQTPVRPQPNVYSRAPSAVPIPQPHHQARPQPPPAQYRPQMYAPQLAKAQGPYGHSGMPQQYVPSPAQQPRMPPQQPPPPHYNNMVPAGAPPNSRFPQAYPAGYPQQQPIHPQHMPPHAQSVPMPPQHHPPMTQQPMPAPYSPYPNGAPMPRTMSPQVPPQPPHTYAQSPTPQHQQMPRPPPPYGPGTTQPGMPPNTIPRPPPQQYVPGSPGPAGMMPARPPQHQPVAPTPPPGQHPLPAAAMPSYAPVMTTTADNLQPRPATPGHQAPPPGGVVGLAGIGLAGQMDVHKLAAAKMQMAQAQQRTQTPVPVPQVPGQVPPPQLVNGTGVRTVAPSPSPVPGTPTVAPAPVPVPPQQQPSA